MTSTRSSLLSSTRWLALAAAALLQSTSVHAVIVAPETPFYPGAAMGAGTDLTSTSSLAGTVLADQTVPFDYWAPEVQTHPIFSGTLRSVVVRRTDTLTLDFYYQIVNTTGFEDLSNDGDIMQLTLDRFAGFGFADDNLEALYRTDGLAGLTGAGAFVAGTRAPSTAFREPEAPGGIGFGYPTDPLFPFDDPNSLSKDETGQFLVVRTNAVDYAATTALVVGSYGGATPAQAFAPVPEPTAAGLTALGALGLALRRSRPAR